MKNLYDLLCWLLFLALGFPLSASAQSETLRSETAPASRIIWEEEGPGIHFDAQLRPLRQIAGAPEAFYTYFWEFGDGEFSFNERPQHVYADSGAYTVRLFATNNYDDGRPPPTRPALVQVSSKKAAVEKKSPHTGFFNGTDRLQLKVNRQPRPDENMICIIGYRNPAKNNKSFNGSLVLFYNEDQFKKRNFGLKEIREYHDEGASDMKQLLASCRKRYERPVYAYNQLPARGPADLSAMEYVANNKAVSLLLQQQHLFEDHSVRRFKQLRPGDERYLFVELQTTPEMIKDTNATVKLTAMMIPEDPNDPIEQSTIELQIVSSHDPNRMMLSNRRLNYRFMGNHKKLKYKVRFQNTGKGPANKIDIGVAIAPPLDPATVTLNKMYPDCIPCATAQEGQSCLDTVVTKDSIHFIFKNIYLPGIRQDGVENKDSTKGFVEYHIKFKEKPKKLPFYCQAGIVFDKNDPIYTNKMHSRFIHGLSPALIAGYQWGFNDAPQSFTIGGAIAPYAPYRWYFQAEAFLNFNKKETVGLPHRQMDSIISRQGEKLLVTGKDVSYTKSMVSLSLIPIEIKKNINSFFGVGAGLWLKGNISQKTIKEEKLQFIDAQTRDPGELKEKFIEKADLFSNTNIGGFVDITLGKVRVGPSIGCRLVHFFSPNETGIMAYAMWRF